jgi:hypothetical protein
MFCPNRSCPGPPLQSARSDPVVSSWLTPMCACGRQVYADAASTAPKGPATCKREFGGSGDDTSPPKREGGGQEPDRVETKDCHRANKVLLHHAAGSGGRGSHDRPCIAGRRQSRRWPLRWILRVQHPASRQGADTDGTRRRGVLPIDGSASFDITRVADRRCLGWADSPSLESGSAGRIDEAAFTANTAKERSWAAFPQSN